MRSPRKIKRTFKSHSVLEGAGVNLKRAFGRTEAPLFDPFLMLDDFRSDDPGQYEKGFPWHPHRGIETITYVLEGDVEHQDSLGNRGIISSGDVQWMTAGSGIIHQEMPRGGDGGAMHGFQLWVNLPRSGKMMDPRYRDVKSAQIPVVKPAGGTEIKVICGQVGDISGPVRDIVSDPEYLDVKVPPRTVFDHVTDPRHKAFAYVIAGAAFFDDVTETLAGNEDLLLFDGGEKLVVTTMDEPVRFLFLSGRPIGEPVAWMGPVVMNTEEELHEAFKEYDAGTFTKHRAA